MGTQIITQPQTFKTDSTVMGLGAGLSATAGLTLYGNLSASGDVFANDGTFTGQILFADGTVTAPAIANSGDTNNGIYFPATDTLGFVTNGLERLRVASTGNVGVGTTTPNEKLTVSGNISASGTIYGIGVGPVLNTASGTGSQTAFTITGYTNTTPQNYLVTVGGLVQRPTTDYTVTANTINFTTAPPNGVQISILAYQTTIGATANNTTIQTQTEGGATSTVSTLNFDNGLSARTIGSTTQVRLPEASAGQVLTYDGSTSNWVASAAPGSSTTYSAASYELRAASGTTMNFDVPANINTMIIGLSGVSTNGTDFIIVQLGTATNIITAGYISNSTSMGGGNLFADITTGFLADRVEANWYGRTGSLIFNRSINNTWFLQSTVANHVASGVVKLTDPLTRFRMTTYLGANSYDAGYVLVTYM